MRADAGWRRYVYRVPDDAESPQRRFVVCEGPLALRMRRASAAAQGELGVDIATLPLMAARLAGGFLQPATASDLNPAIRKVLSAGGFADIEPIRDLPGMARAVTLSLTRIWNAGIDLGSLASRHARFADLARIERELSEHLPAAWLTPRALRDSALVRVASAPAILGAVELDGVTDVAPLWRPLIDALCNHVEVTWRTRTAAPSWFRGEVIAVEMQESAPSVYVVCANPHAEVIEALRWARELIASGRAQPGEIAICATATEAWDEAMLALAADARLPLHASHGSPALATGDGQACAALADVMLAGLSQARVRRLLAHVAGKAPLVRTLDRDWGQGLSPDAALNQLDHWKSALDDASARRTSGADPRPILTPALELLTRGPDAADELGAQLLPSGAREIWSEALRRAPARGLALALEALRVPDGSDATASVAWCPASHLAAAPRPFVRLIGMTSRSWPRRGRTDPLLPDHILAPDMIEETDIAEADREALTILSAHASSALVFSRARRDAQGRTLAPSPLAPRGARWSVLQRERIPEHAFNETDRLYARPEERTANEALAAAALCWRNGRTNALTAHDGAVRADHPAVLRALDEVQSATSLKLMLRDPIGFVWRYALGWRAPDDTDGELELDARGYGDLVHDLLKQTVDALEAGKGLATASPTKIEAALNAARAGLEMQWPLERATPPLLLWRHTLDLATVHAQRALALAVGKDTKFWTEVAFGQPAGAPARAGAPWPAEAEVTLPQSRVRIRGAIDRLDHNPLGDVRITDYKTGAVPQRADRVFDGGAEVQRVIYAATVRQLMPDAARIRAQLLYLRTDPPVAHAMADPDAAIAELDGYIAVAKATIARGACHPGEDAFGRFNDMRLALPATLTSYREVKRQNLARALSDLARAWRAK